MNNQYGRNTRYERLAQLCKPVKEIAERDPMSRIGHEARSALAQAGRAMMGQARLADTIEWLESITASAE